MNEKTVKVALIVGAGDSTGGAIARRFAAGGFIACVTRRDAAKLAPLIASIEAEGGIAHGYGSDARKEDEVVALVERAEREVGPKNIHVAHVVVDGAIDTDFIRTNFPEKYATKADDGILDPAHIAENYWHLHMQPRDSWTFELDLRPWNERW